MNLFKIRYFSLSLLMFFFFFLTTFIIFFFFNFAIVIIIASYTRAIRNENREDCNFIITFNITILKNEVESVKKKF